MRTSLQTTTAKLFASVVLVGGAAGVAGLGTFGSFTDTTSVDQAVGAGKVDLGLTQHATAGTTIPAANLVPGDTVQRAVTLTRGSDTEKFGSVLLSTTAGTANALSSDPTNGLQLKVDECSSAWVAEADKSLSCSGTVTTLVTSRGVLGANVPLGSALASLNGSAAASHLRLQLQLPETANNTFQGLSNVITFKFDVTQRAAGNR